MPGTRRFFSLLLAVGLLSVGLGLSPVEAIRLRFWRGGDEATKGESPRKSGGVLPSLLSWPAFTDSGEIASDVARMNQDLLAAQGAALVEAMARQVDTVGGRLEGAKLWGKLLMATMGLGFGEVMAHSRDLLSASSRGDVTLIKFFISSGADINACGSSGETALMAAAAEGHAGAVEVLLQEGADQALKNGRGQTAIKLARQRRDSKGRECIKVLSKRRKKAPHTPVEVCKLPDVAPLRDVAIPYRYQWVTAAGACAFLGWAVAGLAAGRFDHLLVLH